MVVLSVLSRHNWWCYQSLVDSYGGIICSMATFMVVLFVLRRQLWCCYQFLVDSYGSDICS